MYIYLKLPSSFVAQTSAILTMSCQLRFAILHHSSFFVLQGELFFGINFSKLHLSLVHLAVWQKTVLNRQTVHFRPHVHLTSNISGSNTQHGSHGEETISLKVISVK